MATIPTWLGGVGGAAIPTSGAVGGCGARRPAAGLFYRKSVPACCMRMPQHAQGLGPVWPRAHVARRCRHKAAPPAAVHAPKQPRRNRRESGERYVQYCSHGGLQPQMVLCNVGCGVRHGSSSSFSSSSSSSGSCCSSCCRATTVSSSRNLCLYARCSL
jgi:hypothetical protein